MQWGFVVALILAIPVILLPLAFMWYANVGGIYRAIQEARKRRAAREAEVMMRLLVKKRQQP